jgi:hypothetical protein
MYSKLFPNSNNSNFIVKSENINDKEYNCISWACSRNDVRFWPNLSEFIWPSNLPNIEHIDSFVKLFKSIGYDICNNGNLEYKFEKICIYEKNACPKHAARQLTNGWWTSKLGPLNIVEHTIDALDGGVYGEITTYMSRPIQ